ncbi:MAG: DUF3558 domain-containing protein [Actinophytocola sp.]|uniref:DUF3558 domain-containing protein n=1 Tax=Actinophytocola sp. TaxID=1872138 RepID=UPI00132806E7|nr:DUF3558 domain-containing protein [Actinophytocola sp.]MPZ84105.1 DUF3558 domain-containing protein [Actinophytocola sp.]
MRRTAPFAMCAATLTLLAGCAGSTAGEPAATDPPSSTRPSTEDSSESAPESAPESEAPAHSLARLCELLSPEEAQKLGGSAEGEKGNSISDGHEQCTWSSDTSLVIGVQPGLKTTSVRTGPGITNTPTTIDGLTAVQSKESDPIVVCQVLVDLPSGNLFGTSAALLTGGAGEYDPCTLATEMANIIVPKVNDQ